MRSSKQSILHDCDREGVRENRQGYQEGVPGRSFGLGDRGTEVVEAEVVEGGYQVWLNMEASLKELAWVQVENNNLDLRVRFEGLQMMETFEGKWEESVGNMQEGLVKDTHIVS